MPNTSVITEHVYSSYYRNCESLTHTSSMFLAKVEKRQQLHCEKL